jgi:hypothetical protein
MMNPYEAPTIVDDTNDIAEPVDPRTDWIPAAVTGLRWIYVGSLVALVGMMITVTSGIAFNGSSFNNVILSVMFVAALLAMGAIAIGLLAWFPISKISIVAFLLHSIGGSGVAIYADVMIRGRGTGTLINLFGASVTATLLTGQALVMLVIYLWTKRTHAIGISQWATLPLFGYAFCAAVVSLFSLQWLALPVSREVMTLAVVLVGILSLANQAGVIGYAIWHLRTRVVADES